MSDEREGSYEVGYKRPPEHTRFAKGQSGNTKGGPRGSRNLTTLIEDELKQRLLINENGRQRKITKREAAAKQLVNKAVAGDRHFLELLLGVNRVLEGRAESSPGTGVLEEADRELMRRIQERMRRAIPDGEEDGSDDRGKHGSDPS
jgi:hypothetical protein